jgi:beta-lactam-binding protein with PASTA domain
VPPVAGLTLLNAQQQLTAPPYKFIVQQANCNDPAYQPGYVCRTYPAAGSPVLPGSQVTVYVEQAAPTSPASTSPSPSTSVSPSPSDSTSPGGGG